MLTSSAPALKLPLLNSKNNLLVAVNNLLVAVGEVLRAMAERRIKRSEADTFLCGLKFASRLMTEIDREAESHSTGADDAHAPNARPSREASAGKTQTALTHVPIKAPIKPGAALKPYLKSAHSDESSFIEMLCAKAQSFTASQPSRSIHI